MSPMAWERELNVARRLSGRRWIIDPIDGTKDYLRGCPTWGVLPALEAELRRFVVGGRGN